MSDFESIFRALSQDLRLHIPGTEPYLKLKADARQSVEKAFSGEAETFSDFGRFGSLCLPFFSMGNITSLDLFGLDELIILLYYWNNRDRYRRVVDIGANLGLHSIIMARCGFAVQAYEPDPRHLEILHRNLRLNTISTVAVHPEAVSVAAGKAEFVRVLGNTTGSHLVGSKDSYGPREFFTVPIVPAKPLFAEADFFKIDAEGHENTILLSTEAEDWEGTEAIVEVGNPENAQAIFQHFKSIGVNLFAQQKSWERVEESGDVPTSHRQGSLFISRAEVMPWTKSS